MKNELMDFYVKLLSLKPSDKFRIKHQALYAAIRDAISEECQVNPEIVQDHFEAHAEIYR